MLLKTLLHVVPLSCLFTLYHHSGSPLLDGAEYQNRTDDGRLEIYSFTIKLIPLCPHGSFELTSTFLGVVDSIWCRMSDSNRRPTAYKAVALPTELIRQNLAEGVRFELTDPFESSVFKTGAIDHSTNLPYNTNASGIRTTSLLVSKSITTRRTLRLMH